MKKIFVSNYIIITDEEYLEPLLSFLNKYRLRVYNYKVFFNKGRIFTRIIVNRNVTLSLENLTLNEAEELFPVQAEESKYPLEFHNIKPSNISFFNSLSFSAAEFHIYNSRVLCNIDGFRCKVKRLEVLKALSDIFSLVERNLKPFNMNYLSSEENLLCEIFLKYYGIRDPKAVNNCKISGNYVIYNGKLLRELN